MVETFEGEGKVTVYYKQIWRRRNFLA